LITQTKCEGGGYLRIGTKFKKTKITWKQFIFNLKVKPQYCEIGMILEMDEVHPIFRWALQNMKLVGLNHWQRNSIIKIGLYYVNIKSQ
jgi:hypothetical protein